MTIPTTTTRLYPLIDPSAATTHTVQATYGEIERELGFGMVPNLFRALGTQPEILRASWDLFRATVLHGELPRIVKELIGVVVSAENKSDYALKVHMHSLGVQGVESAVMVAVAEHRLNDVALAPSVVALLRLAAKAAHEGPLAIAPADLDAARATGVNDAELREALAAINLFQYVNSFTDLALVPIDAL